MADVQDGEYAAYVEESRQRSMKEYRKLKFELLKRTAIAGGCLAGYLFLLASEKASLASLVGTSASVAYLVLLGRSVDAIGPGTRVYIKEAEEFPEGGPRKVAKVLASYRHALQPRLLVLVAVAAGLWLYNNISNNPLGPAEEGCLLLGFLAYKVPLAQFLVDMQKENFGPEGSSDAERRASLEDLGPLKEGELDMYARPREAPEEKVRL